MVKTPETIREIQAMKRQDDIYDWTKDGNLRIAEQRHPKNPIHAPPHPEWNAGSKYALGVHRRGPTRNGF